MGGTIISMDCMEKYIFNENCHPRNVDLIGGPKDSYSDFFKKKIILYTDDKYERFSN